MPIIIETEDALLDAPRTLLAERFAGWYAAHPDLQAHLPADEVVVTVVPAEFVTAFGTPFRGGRGERAVGVFHIHGPDRRLATRWEVSVAYGETYPPAADLQPWEDPVAIDVGAWLTTVAHELEHLREFVREFGGRLPAAVPPGDLLVYSQRDRDVDEDRVESAARTLITQFEAAVPGAFADWALLRGVRAYRPKRRCPR